MKILYLQLKLLEIITDFLKEEKENYLELRNNLLQYKDVFRYVYSNVFPDIYCSTKTRGLNLKSSFHIMFKTYKDKKNIKFLGKYETDDHEQNQ